MGGEPLVRQTSSSGEHMERDTDNALNMLERRQRRHGHDNGALNPLKDFITECEAHHADDITEKVSSAGLMAPLSSFSLHCEGDGPPRSLPRSCEEEDTVSYRLKEAASPSPPVLPPPPCRPFSATSLSHKRWNPFRKKSGIMGVLYAQSKRNRVVSKHGKLNTFVRPDEKEEQHRYLKDFFISMIDMSWSFTLLSFAASFFISWLLFAVLWYCLVLYHGDLNGDSEHVNCVDNVKDFTSCFLFSLETQHTIGYGVRAPTEECSLGLLIISLQSIVGVVIQACMAGIVFAKFTKPTMRAETILFSKNALITLRNGSFYLVCRIADLRQTQLLESHVSGHIVKKEVTEEGETKKILQEIPYHLQRMEFGAEIDGTEDFFQMFWPTVLSHKIDSDSPLWDVCARDISGKQFEVVLTFEGTTPETGNTVQVRTSYLPSEILWGYRFEHRCVAYDKALNKYAVSYTAINSFIPDRTPRCSAKEWEAKKLLTNYESSDSS